MRTQISIVRADIIRPLLTAALMLALTFTFSCSGDSGGGGGGNSDAIKREKISGVCEKGPFANGSEVKIYELNAKFEKTKNSFEGKTDSKGYFEIEINNGKLASPYVILEVSGNYMNEVTGKLSTTPITLNAIADVSDKSNANINVLTDLEFDRVMKQVKSGTKFEDAKKEAQKEVLNALGVSGVKDKNSEDLSLFGSSPSDSVLLAVSVLLQGNRSAEEVSDLLADISSEIESNGTLSNSTKSEVANGLANVDMDKVRDNILSLDPNAKVPDFKSSSSTEKLSSSSDVVPSSSSVVSSSSGIKSSSSSLQGTGQIENGVFTDQRDGKKYKVETAPDGTIWMSENLNYSRDNTLGYCYGVDIDGTNPHRDSTTCDNGYGRHYEWAVAMDGNTSQGLCPNGWHIPSTAEWNTIVNHSKVQTIQGKNSMEMTIDFYIYPGNYNTNANYPPLGWKDRGTETGSSGFYWTSSGNSDFIGFWAANCKYGGRGCWIEAQTGASANDYFSVRCIADNNMKISCGGNDYDPATQFCDNGKVYARCGGTYITSIQFCSNSQLHYLCGGKQYEPESEFCDDDKVVSK